MSTRRNVQLISQLVVLTGKGKRLKTSSSSPSSCKSSRSRSSAEQEAKHQQSLKWTERKEAPKWLKRLEPTKGGTSLPTPKEASVMALVALVGYYAWFIDPPKSEEAEECRE